MSKILWYILAGAVSGILGGMGMGGGVLLIPILTQLLQVEQKVAQGINLIAFLPMSIAAIVVHAKNWSSISYPCVDMAKIIRIPFLNMTFMTFQERACVL